jgi:heme-degrading monooxygenase HmoA
MNYVFIAYGSTDYLSTLRDTYESEKLYLLERDEGAALVHEATSKHSFFNQGNEYEVIDGTGKLSTSGFVVFNHIPVSDESRALFESRFKNRPRLIEQAEGFMAIRALKPLNSDTYIVMSVWRNESNFKNWQQSKASKHPHKERRTGEVTDEKTSFPRPSYVTTYTLIHRSRE